MSKIKEETMQFYIRSFELNENNRKQKECLQRKKYCCNSFIGSEKMFLFLNFYSAFFSFTFCLDTVAKELMIFLFPSFFFKLDNFHGACTSFSLILFFGFPEDATTWRGRKAKENESEKLKSFN